MFFTVINNLFNCFQDICYPLKEDELVVLDTGEVMISEIQSRLGNLLEMNEEKYQNFCKRGLIICDVAITATIKNNPINLLLLGPFLIQSMIKLYTQNTRKERQRKHN